MNQPFFLLYRAQKEKINSLQLIANSRILPIFARKGVTMKKLVKHGSMMAAAVVAPNVAEAGDKAPQATPSAPTSSSFWLDVVVKSQRQEHRPFVRHRFVAVDVAQDPLPAGYRFGHSL